MTEDEKSKGMTLNVPGLTEFVGSIWAKILAVLTAISIVLGIALEIQSFVTGYYVLQKTILEEKASEYQPDTSAAQLEITKANVVKAREEAMSAHAVACQQEQNNVLMTQTRPAYKRWLIDCPDYQSHD